MAADFPGAIKTFTVKTDNVDSVEAAHVNDLQNEVTAIETELGANPAGGYASVDARLTSVEGNYTFESLIVLDNPDTHVGQCTGLYHRSTNQGGATPITINLLTATLGENSADAIMVHVHVEMCRYANNGMEIGDLWASGYGTTATWGVVAYAADKVVLGGGVTDPSLAWSGAGATSTLQMTLNSTYTAYNIQIHVTGRNAAFAFA